MHYEVFDVVVPGEEFPTDTPQLVAAVHRTSEAVTLRRNGTFAGESSLPLPITTTRNENLVGWTLYNGCPPFAGQIGEVLVYARAVGDDELVTIEDYLSEKWGCCLE